MQKQTRERWRVRLDEELDAGSHLTRLPPDALDRLVRKTTLTSTNYDTGISLDFPHFCSGATDACGGKNGWCYTFSGKQSSVGHDRKVALVDFMATHFPAVIANQVTNEVKTAVRRGILPYPNLRYAGSGEVALKHIPALKAISENGIRLWGFTKNIEVARALGSENISVIISLDRTSPAELVRTLKKEKFPFAYVSIGVDDKPVSGPFVTFPLHIQGRVREVVDAPNLCPKVVSEFFQGHRTAGTCQSKCHRCHQPAEEPIS